VFYNASLIKERILFKDKYSLTAHNISEMVPIIQQSDVRREQRPPLREIPCEVVSSYVEA